MYSIKQASIRSGVSVPLIRAWERRYGVVSPQRTPSGYRLYDDESIATLVLVRELTETGWSASEASRAVLAGEIPVEVGVAPEIAALTDDASHARAAQLTALTDDASHARAARLIEDFVQAATVMDIAATGTALDEIFAAGSYEAIVDALLMPALVALGEAWSEGELDVAAEHAASAAVHRRLSALYEAAAAIGDPAVVVGLPPGARHELGSLAFSVAVRRRGVGVLYLGADVPVASWVRVIEQNRAKIVVIAIVQESDQSAALDVADALRSAGHSPVLAVGGKHADWDEAQGAGIVLLPARINEAASVTARLANGTATTT